MAPNGVEVNQEYAILNLSPDQIYSFSEGIPGFEKVKQYCLLFKEEEAPFLHLSAVGSYNLEFIVISPWKIISNYAPEISDDDLSFIGSPEKNELIVLVTVVVADPISESTANMAAPIIINAKSGKAKQIVIRNIKQYSSQQKIVHEENSGSGQT